MPPSCLGLPLPILLKLAHAHGAVDVDAYLGAGVGDYVNVCAVLAEGESAVFTSKNRFCFADSALTSQKAAPML